ncbi:hypothetical protein G9447_13085 [Actinopolyspora sp. BKK1]|nr:hypothetical protein [Actinopolyspora sp. BKK2]NHE77135.1 hypothetical protein [Actinopolyspora sp. BKK1]
MVPDPAGIPPLCDEPRFVELLAGMVADHAPLVFAIVQEYGERVDGRIVAWGMLLEDGAEVIALDRRARMSLRTPEEALPLFRFGSHIGSRLIWFDPAAGTVLDEDQHG